MVHVIWLIKLLDMQACHDQVVMGNIWSIRGFAKYFNYTKFRRFSVSNRAHMQEDSSMVSLYFLTMAWCWMTYIYSPWGEMSPE